VKDTDRVVCLKHDRYWPCKLALGEEHCWALQTIHMTYGEREMTEGEKGLDSLRLNPIDYNQANE